MPTRSEVLDTVRDYLIHNHLAELDIHELDEHQPLVTSALLTSVAVVELAAFVEEKYGIEIEPEEMEGAAIDTLADMTDLICAKLLK